MDDSEVTAFNYYCTKQNYFIFACGMKATKEKFPRVLIIITNLIFSFSFFFFLFLIVVYYYSTEFFFYYKN